MKGHCTGESRRSFGARPVLPRASPAPHCSKWRSASSALAHNCAHSLWGQGPARAIPTRARAAPTRRHRLHALWKGTARARSSRSFGARPVLSRANSAHHCARWNRACSVLARNCARSLWQRGPARAVPMRARAAPIWRNSLHTLCKGTARARSRRSFGARPVLLCASPAPHCAKWRSACSALARHCARSLWGRGSARALPTRARAAPRWRHSIHTLYKGTARASSHRSFGARPVLPHASHAPAQRQVA